MVYVHRMPHIWRIDRFILIYQPEYACALWLVAIMYEVCAIPNLPTDPTLLLTEDCRYKRVHKLSLHPAGVLGSLTGPSVPL